MARPQKQTVDYFPHFADASAGDTLTVLEGQFGNDGYVFWFKLLEKLASSEGHYLDCSNSRRWQVLLGRARVDEVTGRKIMVLLVEMQAIDKELWEKHIIWSQNLVDNVAEAYKNRKREIPQRPVPTDNIPISTTGNSITTAENPHTKLNKTIRNKKENIERKHGEFENVLLTEARYQKLQATLGSKAAAERFIEKLSAYMKSTGKSYKDHYATILNWYRREQEGKHGTSRNPRDLPQQYTDSPDYADL